MAQGFLPTQLNYTVRNGNDVVVMLGDQQLAYGQTMDSSISFGTEMKSVSFSPGLPNEYFYRILPIAIGLVYGYFLKEKFLVEQYATG